MKDRIYHKILRAAQSSEVLWILGGTPGNLNTKPKLLQDQHGYSHSDKSIVAVCSVGSISLNLGKFCSDGILDFILPSQNRCLLLLLYFPSLCSSLTASFPLLQPHWERHLYHFSGPCGHNHGEGYSIPPEQSQLLALAILLEVTLPAMPVTARTRALSYTCEVRPLPQEKLHLSYLLTGFSGKGGRLNRKWIISGGHSDPYHLLICCSACCFMP